MNNYNAYFAGFFDGEGTVDIRARHTHNGKYTRFELRVSIPQVIDTPLLKLQELWGGSITRSKVKNINVWCCTSHQAIKFLSDIFPHLLIKNDEVSLALGFANLIGSFERTSKSTGGFAKESEDRVNMKFFYFHELRHLRKQKGFASKHRNPLFAS